MKKITEIFESFNKLNILIVGDVMVDAYLWGNVTRISPEAPVPIVSCTKRENRLGGAANVGLNALALGATPIICSIIGSDEKGEIFMGLMKEKGLPIQGLFRDGSRATTSKTRIISNDQQLLRVDQELTNDIACGLETELLKRIKNAIDNTGVDAIIFQDYNKGTVTPKIIDDVIKTANEKQIPVLVDPKKKNFLSFNNVSLFKPNFKEFTEGLGLDVNKNDTDKLFKSAQKIHQEKNIQNILITLSEKGVFISNKGGYKTFPAEIRDIADVSGAGDTVISVAGVCMAAGMDAETTALISNIAGGLVCEKVGVVPIDKNLLLEECIKLNIGV